METIRVRKLNHANLHIECSSSAAQELNEFFSFYVPGFKFMPAYKSRVWDGKIRLFARQTGELPAGLIHHLVQFCRTRNYSVESVKTKYGLPYNEYNVDSEDISSFCKSLGLGFDVRDYQLLAVKHGLEKRRAILLSPTGSGKSLIIYVLICYFLRRLTTGWKREAGKVLIIVPTTSLVEQMYNAVSYTHLTLPTNREV